MRITGNDKNEIFNRYSQLNEDVGLGPNTPSKGTLGVTTIGNSNTAAANAAKGTSAAMGAGSGNVIMQPNNSPAPGAEESCEEEAIEMAKGQLLNAAHKAVELFEVLHTNGYLEPWAASKITIAADYLEKVADYMMYNAQAHKSEHEEPEVVEIETED
jgi:hypothetical protein